MDLYKDGDDSDSNAGSSDDTNATTDSSNASQAVEPDAGLEATETTDTSPAATPTQEGSSIVLDLGDSPTEAAAEPTATDTAVMEPDTDEIELASSSDPALDTADATDLAPEQSNSLVTPELEPSPSTSNESQTQSKEFTEEQKAEYGLTKMPSKVEVEDLETTDQLLDSQDTDVPEDLEYSTVFGSKTLINYTLAIGGFALVVIGIFSFLNSQNISIKSSLESISQTGKGSLIDSVPALPNIDLSGATLVADSGTAGTVGAGADDAGAVDDNGDADADAGDADADAGDADADAGDADAGDADADDTVDEDILLSDETTDDTELGTGARDASNQATTDDLGLADNNQGFMFGGQSGGTGFGTTDANASELGALLQNNTAQLDLVGSDFSGFNRGGNSFLSNTNNQVITAGNIAGDSGPEIYLALMVSLLFAAYLTKKTI